MHAVILAGGLGTRLRTVVADRPKAMAPVRGRPFLEYILEGLHVQGVRDVTLAVGYLREVIMQHFGDRWHGMKVRYSIEARPLGTGGALKQALSGITDEIVVVLNGDTWLDLDLRAMQQQHFSSGVHVTVAVREVSDVARYGAVEIRDARIVAFREKGLGGHGFINGGSYLLRRDVFDNINLPPVFSFEQDFMMAQLEQLKLGAFLVRGDFIDIGIPEDFARAQVEPLVHVARP